MPRGPDTVYANMTLNGRDPRVQEAERQAASCTLSLGTYLKKLVLALLEQGPLLLVHFREHSRVLSHLRTEAEQMEMPLDAYVLALLADRDRSLYATDARPAALWFPHGRRERDEMVDEDEERAAVVDDVDIEAAMHNVDEFLAAMPDMAGL